MEYLLLGARLLLAAVFLLSSIGKALDLSGAKTAMEGFGIPSSFSRQASYLLIAAEFVVALLLIPDSTAWYAAIGALLLLGAFIIGIAYNMANGRHPDCHCFGQIHSEPAGWPTLIRNTILGAIALFIVLYGTDRWSFSHGNAGESAVDWIRDLTTWETVVSIVGIVALLVMAGLVWLVIHLLGQNGRVLLRLDALEASMENVGSGVAMPAAAAGLAAPAAVTAAPTAPPAGLPVGAKAPAFKLEGIYGETMTLDALRAQGKPVMLLFTDPGCGPCNALLPEISKWQKEHAAVLTIGLISSGTADANRNKAAEHGIAQVLLQNQREVSSQFKAHGTPSAVMVTKDGVIDSPVAAGSAAIRQLVASRTGGTAAPAAAPAAPARQPAPAPAPKAEARPAPGNGAAVAPAAAAAAAPAAPAAPAAARNKGSGADAPAVSLPDLSGKQVSLSDYRGQETMLLFWNPGCGFCRKMADDLKAWEANPQPNAPKLLIVSTGTVEANQAMGLSSPTLLDEGFTTGRAFGASGTPSAVLVNANGKIASGVAVGGPAVMAMARGEDAPAPAPAAAPQAAAQKAGSGEPAPDVVLPDLAGNTVSLRDFKGAPTMLLFWNPGCGFCRKMADELKEWEASPPKGSPRLLVVSTGTVEANQALGLSSTVVLDEGFKTGRAFGASGTPSSVLVDARGRIASAVAVGGPGVMAMARGEKGPAPAPAAPAAPQAPAAKRGDKAPEIALKDIDGRDFTLSNQTGKETVLLFWNPGCGFCKRMTDDLNRWLGDRPASAPEIVLVSTGGADANRAMGIRTTTLMDEGFTTGRKFGAGGTPSGVLIDANGNVASEVAVGAQAVLSLAGAPQGAPS
ncbi:MAG: redoxin domain-containing protein [Thermomicrobiales bacterium]